jgi:DNA mismatch repair protein MutS
MQQPVVDTPLMRQYWSIKQRYPGAILLFRIGDFYETFGEDAEIASRVLGIVLTRRANGAAADVPLAGFPYHALDTYLPKLVRAGYRVAICEQLEDPRLARKVVKRDVVEIVTPGVTFSERILDHRRSHYLVAVHFGERRIGLAFLDVSTGEFALTECETERQLVEQLETLQPAELLADRRHRDRVRALGVSAPVTWLEDWVWGFAYAYQVLTRHFGTRTLKGFGVEAYQEGIVAAGAALHYAQETQRGHLGHVRKLVAQQEGEYMVLDPATQRNLELIAPLQEGGRGEGTLVSILDQTRTAMGARLLRQWLLRPLLRRERIESRLEAVEELLRHRRRREAIREVLAEVVDLERVLGRVCTNRAGPRDLAQIRDTLALIPRIRDLLEGFSSGLLRTVQEELDPCSELRAHIARALVPNPPATLAEGGVIQEGYHKELDELRLLVRDISSWMERFRAEEAARTGIPSLKVGYNRVFGYYIEVTNAHRHKVPADYIRKQTLTGAERYITPALKEQEEKILTAQERMLALEAELFQTLRLSVAEQAEPLQRNARLIALLDVLANLAEIAERYGYVRPTVDDSTVLDIRQGRHPVLERLLPPGQAYVPNDVYLSTEEAQILIITGPNMAGKSALLRQTGLIVLLAQIGSFVPAASARIGVVDKIFTRVGASDNLAAGESTFLVEMHEAAHILHNATPRSLILLDEIGRGTSTFDGLSIAWAIAEYLHETPEVAARTLFATHYHELAELAERYERIRNYHLLVQEQNGKIVFLHRLVPGSTDHSYGIHVAEMAGVPAAVVARAREILAYLESKELELEELLRRGEGSLPRPRTTLSRSEVRRRLRGLDPPLEGVQLSLFAPDPLWEEIRRELEAIDPARLTPIEALLRLAAWKERLCGGGESK